jgi:hypothetical protein
MTKRCSKCALVLPCSAFGRGGDCRLKASCLSCHEKAKTTWLIANPGKEPDTKHIITRVDRKQRKIDATPKMFTRAKQKQIKQDIRELSIVTGIKFSIDHIIPLIHPLVCGLNNEANIQILTSVENNRKANIFNSEDHDYARNNPRKIKCNS